MAIMQASVCLQVSLTRTYDFRNSKRSYTGVPIMSANMDTTGTLEVALALAEQGLFTCLHKFYSVDEVRRLSCIRTSGYLRVHHTAQCVAHALKSLACRAPVFLAHAEVTENIISCFNGFKT